MQDHDGMENATYRSAINEIESLRNVSERSRAQNAKFYSEQINESNRIRLLGIFAGTGRASCSLEYASLCDAAGYDALSYCWGIQKAIQLVLLNSYPHEYFMVSEHLQEGLFRLRPRTGTRHVWVDAYRAAGDSSLVALCYCRWLHWPRLWRS